MKKNYDLGIKMMKGAENICHSCFHNIVCGEVLPYPCVACNQYINASDIAPIRHARLEEPYVDEWFGRLANCNECGSENILPCNYCRICGFKMDGKYGS